MKKLFIGILSLVLFAFLTGCSHNGEPQFRIKNEQLNKANLKIQTAGSNKLFINDVEPGKTNKYQTAPEGNISATDLIRNESISFLAKKNTLYTIVLSEGKPPSIQID